MSTVTVSDCLTDSYLSAALESFLAVAYPFESKNYIHITLRQ